MDKEITLYDHEPAPACAQCGEKLIADYDGEIWHEREFEANEARVLSHVHPPERVEPEPSLSELLEKAEPGQAVLLYGFPIAVKKET